MSKVNSTTELLDGMINTMPVGEKLPAERVLAEMLGVSRPTLRKAMDALVKQRRLRRVQGSGVFIEQDVGALSTMMLLTYDGCYDSHFFRMMISQIERAARARQCQLAVRFVNRETFCVEHPVAADGVIVTGMFPSLSLPSDTPAVAMMQASSPFPGASHVLVDDLQGGIDAGRYLLQLGHRRLAYIGEVGPGSAMYWSFERLRGMRTVVDKSGADASLTIVETHEFRIATDQLRPLLDRQVTAVVCENDQLAMAVISCLHRLGVHVPEQMSVVGFDDIPMSATFHPSLTTFKQPDERIAVTIVDELISKMRSEAPAEPRKILLPMTLIERESTRPSHAH